MIQVAVVVANRERLIMFAAFIVIASILGILAGLVEKLISKEQKEVLERWDSRAHGLLERWKTRPFAEWMRGPRVLFFLFMLALAIIPLFFSGDGSGYYFLPVLVACSVIVALSVFLLGRSRSNASFLVKAVLIAAGLILMVEVVTSVLVGGDDDVIQAYGNLVLTGTFIFVIWYFFVLLSPFISAWTISVILPALEFYYRYCILNNKLPTILFFVILGSAAGVYRLMHG